MSLLLTAPSQTTQSYGAVFPGDDAVSIANEHVHDPTIIPFKDRYFCFSTSGDGFGVLRSSKDMQNWKVYGAVMPQAPAWIQGRYKHRSTWAPDIVVKGDRFRMYYSVSEWGTNRSVIGMAECAKFDIDNPQAGWKDKGLVVESKPGIDIYNAIDPEVVVDASGRTWMFYGSYFGGIFTVELDSETGLQKSPADTPQLVARNLDERGNPLEGAAVCFRDGYYYLFVSYGLAAQGVRSTYRIMVGRSKSVTGPFLDAEGKSMVEGGHLNMMNTSPPMFSPGHSDIFQDPSGRWFMPYHFYDGRHYWTDNKWGRPALQVREVLWTAEGWPLPGLPVEATHLTSRTEKSIGGGWMMQTNFGEPQTLKLSGGGNSNLGPWRQEGDIVKLTLDNGDELHLNVAYHNTFLVGRNRAGQVVRAIRTEGSSR